MTTAFLTLTTGQGHTTRSNVTAVEVSAFSECFLFSLFFFFFFFWYPCKLPKEHFPFKNLVKQTSCKSYKAMYVFACNVWVVQRILMIFSPFFFSYFEFSLESWKKSLGSALKNRVGRKTGNNPFFSFFLFFFLGKIHFIPPGNRGGDFFVLQFVCLSVCLSVCPSVCL